MTTGTLENPVLNTNPEFYQLKCELCDSKAFAINLPKDLDKYYKSCEGEERDKDSMFPKLFSNYSEGHYYHYVPITCAKCGTELEDALFRSLTDLQSGDWKPPNERTETKGEDA